MEFISTLDAPGPAGHYSQAVVHRDLVFVAGQLPIDPATGEMNASSPEEQTRQALKNVAAILEAGGSGIDRVLKTTVYVADMTHWPRINQAYAEFFGSHRPARALVPIRDLRPGVLVEIEAIGVVG